MEKVTEITEDGARKTTLVKAPVKLQAAPSPHISATDFTTRRMMVDVLIGLAPVVIMSIVVFQWYAVVQLGICVLSCLAAEAVFTKWRSRPLTLNDYSAAVTGIILALSLPWSAPWYVGFIASFVGIGIGKIIFGGLGQNLFNPAMVGRAFVMITFPAALGASAYMNPDLALKVVTEATPLTVAKQMAQGTELWPLFLGTVNGSLGETSAIACLLGGLYLIIRRTASWEVPLSTFVVVIIFGFLVDVLGSNQAWTVGFHVLSGALLFGAFFIATDPVTNPLTPKGKLIFGAGFGFFVMLIRIFSGYPEGVMFAILLMNAFTPLINRLTIPAPLGGPVPERK